jgi:rare lipoprotein A
MRTTKLVFFAVIGLAMLEFSLGQACNSVAATTAPKTSHASPKIASPAKKIAKKSHAVVRSHKSGSSLNGVAVVYSDRLNGRKTASGQRFSQKQLTAAHRTLPLGTKVRVTNVRNQQSVDVVINDRGPWHAGRIIDLSAAAAAQVGMHKTGKALVKLEILNESAVNNS